MNKRIKKKVSKRIIRNMMNNEPLTDFEKKYFKKIVWNPLKKMVNVFMKAITVEMEEEFEAIKKTLAHSPVFNPNIIREVNGLDKIDAEEFNSSYITKDGFTYEVTKPRIDGLVEQLTEKDISGCKTGANSVKEPSKWQKVKIKVKGWFSK